MNKRGNDGTETRAEEADGQEASAGKDEAAAGEGSASGRQDRCTDGEGSAEETQGIECEEG
ncbi:MAG: hypothetical protein ACRELF_16835, partial [Gemmataceae bacterium]